MGEMRDAVEVILRELGEDPQRPGLLKTPRRVEESLRFLTRGYQQSLEDILECSLSLHFGV